MAEQRVHDDQIDVVGAQITGDGATVRITCGLASPAA